MNIFHFRDELIRDYAEYIASFINVRDTRILDYIDEKLKAGVLWPQPLIQLNPSFEPWDIIMGRASSVDFSLIVARAWAKRTGNILEYISCPNGASATLLKYQQYWAAKSPQVDVYTLDAVSKGVAAPHAVDLKKYIKEDEVGPEWTQFGTHANCLLSERCPGATAGSRTAAVMRALSRVSSKIWGFRHGIEMPAQQTEDEEQEEHDGSALCTAQRCRITTQ